MVTAPYDPADPQIMADPYPTYRALRESGRVQWSEPVEAWVVTGFKEVDTALTDPRFSSERSRATGRSTSGMGGERPLASGGGGGGKSMVFTDPPEHTRLRRLVSKAFTPRAVADIEPRITQIIDELLTVAGRKGEFDLIYDFAYPLPVTVIAEMLGVSPEDRDDFKRWSDNVIATLGGRFTPPEVSKAAAESVAEFSAYLQRFIADRREHPQDDLISALIVAEDEGQALSNAEVFSTALLLLVAGNETTTHLIGNGMLELFKNPEQLQRLRDDLTLIPSAVEELLRYAGPAHLLSRVALERLELGGQVIEPGNLVVVLIGAANRDPLKYENPEQLDVARNPTDHLAFGDGIHFCLGAPLARLETRIALKALLTRFPNLRCLDDNPEWGGTFVVRGVKELKVAV